jgi:hypothetical protein
MNAKEELTKLLMESYNQGVEDAKQAAMEAFAVAIDAAVRVERGAICNIVEDEIKRIKPTYSPTADVILRRIREREQA